ncbi:hypothetical protein ATY27_08080 [Rheinheimera sp. F8]|nr:hypothetical protein ATY27_08080 [Rheinheimera sp. F8]
MHRPNADLSDIKLRAGKADILPDVRRARYLTTGNGLFISRNNEGGQCAAAGAVSVICTSPQAELLSYR